MSTSSSAPTARPRSADRQGRHARRDPRRDRRRARLRRRQPHRRRGRDLRADGPLRLGQVDAAARRQPAQRAGARQRAGQGRRQDRSTSPLATPTRCAASARDTSPWCSSNSRCCPGARSRRMSASGWSLPACPRPSARQRVDRQLKLVGLDQWAKKYAHELSGGMQQRVGLARAFATEAPILLMDEPFSALDPLIRTKLQDELLAAAGDAEEDHHLRQPRPRRGAEDRQPHHHHGGRAHRPDRRAGGHRAQARQRLCARLHRQREPALGADRLERHARPPRPRSRPATAGSGSTGARPRASRSTRDGLVAAAERDGKPAVWVSCDDVEKLPDDAPHVFWARPGTSLKTVMLAMHRSQTSPVALFDDQSRFVGAIGVRDVLSAVLRR